MDRMRESSKAIGGFRVENKRLQSAPRTSHLDWGDGHAQGEYWQYQVRFSFFLTNCLSLMVTPRDQNDDLGYHRPNDAKARR